MEFTDQDYELLSAYLDGDLSTGERAALEARLVAEPGLQRELAALRQTVQLVNSLPQLKAPRDFVLTPAMVSNKVIPFPEQQRSRMLKLVLPVLSAAASLLVILIGLGALLSSQSPQSSGVNATAPQVAGFASPTAMLTVDATQDDSLLNQALLATEDAAEEVDDELIEPEADDQSTLLMFEPSEPPADGEFNTSSGGAVMASPSARTETQALLTASPPLPATGLPAGTRSADEGSATALYYESAPSSVETEIVPPGNPEAFAAPTLTDGAASGVLTDVETQTKLLTETPVTEEMSSMAAAEEQDILPGGEARRDLATGVELSAVNVSIWIAVVVTLVRLLS